MTSIHPLEHAEDGNWAHVRIQDHQSQTTGPNPTLIQQVNKLDMVVAQLVEIEEDLRTYTKILMSNNDPNINAYDGALFQVKSAISHYKNLRDQLSLVKAPKI